jgi:5-methylcytosine-specific restriction enzyme subunit McrC
MKPNPSVTVFEHDRLRVDGKVFREEHLATLDRWSNTQKRSLLQVGRNGVRFSEYVGVLQVNDLVIEILPKIGRFEEEAVARDRWRDALIGMLQIAGVVRSRSAGNASLRTSHSSLLDVLFGDLLARVDEIVRRGLYKGYHHSEANLGMIRGKIVFGQHVKRNHIHREMSFCRYLTHTADTLPNQILKRAVDIVSRSSRVPRTSAMAKRLLLHLDQVTSREVTCADLPRVVYTRANDHYRDAIGVARLIIEGLAPSLSAGGESVIAILFDMNELFEAFTYRLFKRTEREIPGLQVRGQQSKLFWEKRRIRPDVVLELDGRRIIVDTKWKTPINNVPADPDLKQMFAYNRVFDSKESYLVYPATCQFPLRRTGSYSEGSGACSMEYIQLFDSQQRLRRNLLPEVRRLLAIGGR